MIKQLTIMAPITLVTIISLLMTGAVNADVPFRHAMGLAAENRTVEVQPEGFAALDAIERDDLAGLSGRDNLTNVQSIQELDATVSNSSFNADTIMSGAITIEQHALDHFEGVGMFNIFTGNNNAVDSAVGISVYITE